MCLLCLAQIYKTPVAISILKVWSQPIRSISITWGACWTCRMWHSPDALRLAFNRVTIDSGAQLYCERQLFLYAVLSVPQRLIDGSHYFSQLCFPLSWSNTASWVPTNCRLFCPWTLVTFCVEIHHSLYDKFSISNQVGNFRKTLIRLDPANHWGPSMPVRSIRGTMKAKERWLSVPFTYKCWRWDLL